MKVLWNFAQNTKSKYFPSKQFLLQLRKTDAKAHENVPAFVWKIGRNSWWHQNNIGKRWARNSLRFPIDEFYLKTPERDKKLLCAISRKPFECTQEDCGTRWKDTSLPRGFAFRSLIYASGICRPSRRPRKTGRGKRGKNAYFAVTWPRRCGKRATK